MKKALGITTDAIQKCEVRIREHEVSIWREVAQNLRIAASDWDFESEEYRMALKRVADAMDAQGKAAEQAESGSLWIQ